jgi:hypothetical protein
VLADVTAGFHEEHKLVSRVRGVLHSRAQAEGSSVLRCLRHEHVSWEQNRLVSSQCLVAGGVMECGVTRRRCGVGLV